MVTGRRKISRKNPLTCCCCYYCHRHVFYKQKQLDPLAIPGRTEPTKDTGTYSAIEPSIAANSRSSPAVKKGSLQVKPLDSVEVT